MSSIKFIVDSSSDIPDQDLTRYNIDMLSVPIAVDGEGYLERVDFTIPEFYEILEKSSEIPVTSRVPQDEYLKAFQRAYAAGYAHVVSVTINAKGSGTYDACRMAADLFFEENPEAKDAMQIHAVDSQTYSMVIGHGVLTAAGMAEDGCGIGEILDYLADYYSRVEVYLASYSLEYAKKSGRLSAASAFVGDVLGLRPVIALIGGKTRIVDKVRGERQLLQKLLESFREHCADPEGPAFIIGGSAEQHSKELQALFEGELGRTLPIYQAGAAIVVNSGPKIAAIVCMGKKRE